MKDEGVADSDVCALFALHDPSASCPGFVARRSWLGCARQRTRRAGMLDCVRRRSGAPGFPGAAPGARSAA